MSYWVSLEDENENIYKVAKHQDGGTYVLGGTNEAELNITYNYSNHICKYIDGGINSLHGKKAGEFIDILQTAVDELGVVRDSDYWKSTPGNVGYALSILLKWARQYPDGIFKVW